MRSPAEIAATKMELMSIGQPKALRTWFKWVLDLEIVDCWMNASRRGSGVERSSEGDVEDANKMVL